jgi:hypothetical protein
MTECPTITRTPLCRLWDGRHKQAAQVLQELVEPAAVAKAA